MDIPAHLRDLGYEQKAEWEYCYRPFALLLNPKVTIPILFSHGGDRIGDQITAGLQVNATEQLEELTDITQRHQFKLTHSMSRVPGAMVTLAGDALVNLTLRADRIGHSTFTDLFQSKLPAACWHIPHSFLDELRRIPEAVTGWEVANEHVGLDPSLQRANCISRVESESVEPDGTFALGSHSGTEWPIASADMYDPAEYTLQQILTYSGLTHRQDPSGLLVTGEQHTQRFWALEHSKVMAYRTTDVSVALETLARERQLVQMGRRLGALAWERNSRTFDSTGDVRFTIKNDREQVVDAALRHHPTKPGLVILTSEDNSHELPLAIELDGKPVPVQEHSDMSVALDLI